MGLQRALESFFARAVSSPPDLGRHPADDVPLSRSPDLAHIAAALPGRYAHSPVSCLLSARAPRPERGPDPTALFAAEAAGAEPLASGPIVRVLSYNTALLGRDYLDKRVEMPRLAERRPLLAETLLSKAAGHDILLLQEVWDWADVERFEAVAEREGFVVWAGSREHHEEHGLVVCVRANVIEQQGWRAEGTYGCQYPLEFSPGPRVRRGWLSWQLTIGGRDVWLFNTHLAPFPRFWRVRLQQARELGLAVADVAANACVVVGGDMNAAAWYPQDHLATGDGRIVGDWWANAMSYGLLRHYGGLTDAAVRGGLVTAPGEEQGHTATDENTLHAYSYLDTEFPARMDHVLVRGPLAVRSCRIAYRERLAAGYELSDHYGVEATLQIAARGGA